MKYETPYIEIIGIILDFFQLFGIRGQVGSLFLRLLCGGFRNFRHLPADGFQPAALTQLPEAELAVVGVHILEDVLDFAEQGILNGEGLAHAVDQHTILHGEQEVGIRGDVAVLAGGFQHGHLFAHTLDGADNQLDGVAVLDERVGQVVRLADVLQSSS